MSGELSAPYVRLEIGELHNKDHVLALAKAGAQAVADGEPMEPFRTVMTLQGWEGRFGPTGPTTYGIVLTEVLGVALIDDQERYVFEGVNHTHGGPILSIFDFASDQGTAELLM